MPDPYIQPFTEGTVYHVYCKAVGDSVLFRSDDNRRYFLQQYQQSLQAYTQTYCYILMENHVHWLIRCRPLEEIYALLAANAGKLLKKHQEKLLNGELEYNAGFELQFRDFFIGYAKAYNKMFGRNGALFITPFKRIAVKNDSHFSHLCVYIHANVRRHGVLNDFENYKWSSYKELLAENPSWLMQKEALDWFGGREAFVKYHREQADFYFGEWEGIEGK